MTFCIVNVHGAAHGDTCILEQVICKVVGHTVILYIDSNLKFSPKVVRLEYSKTKLFEGWYYKTPINAMVEFMKHFNIVEQTFDSYDHEFYEIIECFREHAQPILDEANNKCCIYNRYFFPNKNLDEISHQFVRINICTLKFESYENEYSELAKERKRDIWYNRHVMTGDTRNDLFKIRNCETFLNFVKTKLSKKILDYYKTQNYNLEFTHRFEFLKETSITTTCKVVFFEHNTVSISLLKEFR